VSKEGLLAGGFQAFLDFGVVGREEPLEAIGVILESVQFPDTLHRKKVTQAIKLG
jgi:hypothetical protein